MFGISIPEVLLILAIALIVLGPKKLPELAKSLGRGIAEFKKATNEIKESINFDDDFNSIKSSFNDASKNMGSTVNINKDDEQPVETDADTSDDPDYVVDKKEEVPPRDFDNG
jgi:sec-independent protein translocase protein TatB